MKYVLILLFIIFPLINFAFIINIPDDQPTIQAGINVTVNGDTVLVQPGTYIENINYNGKNITVASLFYTTQDTTYISQTIIDGNQDDTVVRFESGEDSTSILTGFTITNGNANPYGGGIYCDNSSPSLVNVIIMNNLADKGGGISCTDCSPILENVTIDNNMVDTYGGGIYCTFNSSPSLMNVIIMNNSSDNNGGGIYCGSNSSPNLLNATIANNSAEIHGGGIYCEWNSNINLFNSTIIDNSANYSGGGIYIFESSPEIEQSIIEGNSAYDGGGIYCYTNSNPTISNNKINNNSAIVSGGGIYCYNGSVSNIINNEFSYNEALVGGGISILDADPSIINNNFSHNEAVEGGGIHISASSCIMINNTISNNTATYQGGGISITYVSSPFTINTIFWGNEANLSGNEIYIRHYDCEPEFYYCDIQGGLNAFGYGQGASFNGVYENNLDSDPLFLGSGEHPYSLLEDSPCIDAGIPDTTGLNLPPWDIIGNHRIWDGDGNGSAIIDMGAYEYGAPPYVEIDDNVIVQIPDIQLYQNHPNPFNPQTTISFQISENGDVNLSIYNIKGQKIKTIVNQKLEQGLHQITWDGKNDNNQYVASGVYFYKLKVNNKNIAIKKCILLK